MGLINKSKCWWIQMGNKQNVIGRYDNATLISLRAPPDNCVRRGLFPPGSNDGHTLL